jgi:hypothetical protein
MGHMKSETILLIGGKYEKNCNISVGNYDARINY